MSTRDDRGSCAFELLRSANPVELGDIRRELDEERLAAAQARALARLGDRFEPELGCGHLQRRATGGSRRSAHGLRLAATAGALAAAAAAVATVLPDGGEPARAVQVLNAAATVARVQPATAPRPHDYVYVKQRFGLLGGPAETVEWWVASDGSGRMRRSGAGAVGVMTGADGRRTIVEGRGRTARDVTFGAGRFDTLYERVNPGVLVGDVGSLPIDPRQLDAALRRKLREAPDFNSDPATQSLQMLQLIEEILGNPLASPELRSAVYGIAAKLEGVQTREHVRDPVGRPATAIALCSAAIPASYELFFDPATTAALGTREVGSVPCNGEHSQRSGVTAYSVYLARATVDSINERP
jgi:hypothetical protein